MSMLDKYRKNIKDDEESFGGNYAVEKKLKKELPNIFRVVDPDSAIEYFEMWPVCDDGDKRPFIIENDHQGQSVLSRLLGDRKNFFKGGILDSRLDEFKQKYFVYEAQDPELLLLVAHNNDKSGDNGSWKPTRRYGFNVIDRETETEGNLVGQNWCVVNKHTKLFKMGSQGLTSILDVRDNNGNLEDYDINYKKSGKGKKGTIHNAMKAGDQIPTVVVGGFTEEEKAYELYNLKVEGALSLARYILKYLSKTIERIDGVLGTNYLLELQEQAKLEAQDSDEEYTPVVTQSPVQNKVPVNTKNEKTSTPSVQHKASIGAEAAVQPPPIRTRATQEKDKEKNIGLIICPFCKKEVPLDETCKECNKKLLEPCDACGTPFLVTLDVCPSCHKQFALG